MLAKLDEEEARIPPPQIESDDIRADLSLLSSLSGLIAQLEWPADREQIAIANRLLRDVIIRVEWPDRPVKYKPRIRTATWLSTTGYAASAKLFATASIALCNRLEQLPNQVEERSWFSRKCRVLSG